MIASPLLHPRIGFVVPKYGRTAVARNRLKRQLREITRIELLPALPCVDIVIKTRPAAYTARFSILTDQLRQLSAEITRLFS